ncbi:hypothetical protein V1289_002647 [Bradyrhizobium sp. AZCC 2289]
MAGQHRTTTWSFSSLLSSSARALAWGMAHANSFPANAVTGADTGSGTGPARRSLVRTQSCKIQNRIGGLSNRQGSLPSISIACRSQRTTIVPAATSDRRMDGVSIRESGETSLMSPCGIYWSNSTGSHLTKARRLVRPISSGWVKAGIALCALSVNVSAGLGGKIKYGGRTRDRTLDLSRVKGFI